MPVSSSQNLKTPVAPIPRETNQYLQSWIKMYGEFRVADEGDKISTIDKRALILVEEGAWQMIVGGQKTMNIICAGGMVWLDSLVPEDTRELTYYKIISRTKYYELPISSISFSVPDPEFVNGIFDFVTRSSCEISNKWLTQCTNDSYKQIKNSLEWIASLPNSIKEKFTIIFFISATTGVSRSHALAIVKALKEGSYIEVNRGYLVRILKKLPSSY
ncbi:helix-turn-helix domain-containing protein [Pseudomonas sp. NPDC087346]|uniref:helix-turn-helix domain-containing protein n=1 Tax=Pseudomonas sp. NPDC087346 TaxID=3364438 RepID=UPI003823AD8A